MIGTSWSKGLCTEEQHEALTKADYRGLFYEKVSSSEVCPVFSQEEPDPDPPGEEREEGYELLQSEWFNDRSGGVFSFQEFFMTGFVVTSESSSHPLEKVGRFRIKGEFVVIYLDGIGSFVVGKAQVVAIVLGLGDEVIRDRAGGEAGVMSLSDSGRGLRMGILGEQYVAPVQRVKRVLEGKEWKGAVFEMNNK